jgi:ubiquitin-conjugating enzyme E2 Q
MSPQYEIRSNPDTVDLLVSLTYSAAAEGVLDQPLPVGMGLRVPVPHSRAPDSSQSVVTAPVLNGISPVAKQPTSPKKPRLESGADRLYDFDEMNLVQVRSLRMATFDCQTLHR